MPSFIFLWHFWKQVAQNVHKNSLKPTDQHYYKVAWPCEAMKLLGGDMSKIYVEAKGLVVM